MDDNQNPQDPKDTNPAPMTTPVEEEKKVSEEMPEAPETEAPATTE